MEHIKQQAKDQFQKKIDEIKRLGINTYSLVLIWASFKSLTQLFYNIMNRSPGVVNYQYDQHDDDKHDKYFLEQS